MVGGVPANWANILSSRSNNWKKLKATLYYCNRNLDKTWFQKLLAWWTIHSVSLKVHVLVHVLFKHCCALARTVDDLFFDLIWLGGSICEPLMQTTTAGRVMLIHQLVLKGDLKELKKEIARDIGQFMINMIVQFTNCTLIIYMKWFILWIALSSLWKTGCKITMYIHVCIYRDIISETNLCIF